MRMNQISARSTRQNWLSLSLNCKQNCYRPVGVLFKKLEVKTEKRPYAGRPGPPP